MLNHSGQLLKIYVNVKNSITKKKLNGKMLQQTPGAGCFGNGILKAMLFSGPRVIHAWNFLTAKFQSAKYVI